MPLMKLAVSSLVGLDIQNLQEGMNGAGRQRDKLRVMSSSRQPEGRHSMATVHSNKELTDLFLACKHA